MARTEPRRVCLFTGISGRLGQDWARRHAGRYDIVGVHRRRPPPGPWAELGSRTRDEAGIWSVRADLGAEGAVDDLVDRVLDRFGSVDLVVNAAVYRNFGPTTDAGNLATLDWQLYVNVSVPARIVGLLTERAWASTPEDNRRRRRNVVNLSSTAGHLVYPGQGQGGYAAAKAALNIFTVHTAAELAPIAVRANVVAPNSFPTLVTTRSVTDAVRRFDKGRETGRILVIDTDGEELLPPALEPSALEPSALEPSG